MTKIALDLGHGLDSKNGGPGMVEYEHNSAVAGYAQKLLKEAGFEVVLIQPLSADSNTLSKRVKIAKESNVDLIISMHADYNDSKVANGY